MHQTHGLKSVQPVWDSERPTTKKYT